MSFIQNIRQSILRFFGCAKKDNQQPQANADKVKSPLLLPLFDRSSGGAPIRFYREKGVDGLWYAALCFSNPENIEQSNISLRELLSYKVFQRKTDEGGKCIGYTSIGPTGTPWFDVATLYRPIRCVDLVASRCSAFNSVGYRIPLSIVAEIWLTEHCIDQCVFAPSDIITSLFEVDKYQGSLNAPEFLAYVPSTLAPYTGENQTPRYLLKADKTEY